MRYLIELDIETADDAGREDADYLILCLREWLDDRPDAGLLDARVREARPEEGIYA
ncbi:MAG: hypothetical protein KJ058_00595 [Thermoanaerobaculia bacterium]|nr:hypothetical protein [Thermoanaerobaculia bacterium]